MLRRRPKNRKSEMILKWFEIGMGVSKGFLHVKKWKKALWKQLCPRKRPLIVEFILLPHQKVSENVR